MHQLSKISFNIYQNEKNKILIVISDFGKESENEYLKRFDVISKNELNINLSTGGISFPSIASMLNTFNSYNDDNVLYKISSFLEQLEIKKIISCYSHIHNHPAALVILMQICKQINIPLTSIVVKPQIYLGVTAHKKFINLLEYMDKDEFFINDFDAKSLDRKLTMRDVESIIDNETFKIVELLIATPSDTMDIITTENS